MKPKPSLPKKPAVATKPSSHVLEKGLSQNGEFSTTILQTFSNVETYILMKKLKTLLHKKGNIIYKKKSHNRIIFV